MLEKSKKTTFITISSILVVMIVFHIIGWLSPVENFLRGLIYPISDGIHDISVQLSDDEFVRFDSVESLQQAYTELNKRYIDAHIDQATLAILNDENTQLREQLSFFSTSTVTHVGAEVIGKNIEPLSRSIVLDKGSNHGISRGDAVVVRNGLLIGTVIRVSHKTAIVRLINDNQSTIAATVINREKSIGLIEGGFGLSVRMKFIPQNEIISIGDIIVSSGLNDTIPKGLVIGKIEAVEKEAYQPFQEAIVTPLIDLDKIDLVSIILSTTTYAQDTPASL